MQALTDHKMVEFSIHIRRNIKKILPIALIWAAFGLVYALLEKGILGDLDYYPSTGNPYSFMEQFPIYFLLVIASGFVVGTFEVLYLSHRFLKQSLLLKIIYKTSIYLSIIITFLVISSSLTNATKLGKSVLDPEVIGNVITFAGSFAFLSVIIFIASIIMVSLFYNEVSENLGVGVLMNFFTGKYHRPQQEERVFMFLDMKSSTAIAEQIGHVKYFEMLKEYYDDLTGPIVEHQGEIYQYVGDEVIISWKLKTGLKNNNCLKCFFSMKEVIESNSEKYRQLFGVQPSFKAGLHYGSVTTGEIGRVKKEILFTGDVLNTTARIQGMCNTLNEELLISENLKKQLDDTHAFHFQSYGDTILRGREKTIVLYSVQKHE